MGDLSDFLSIIVIVVVCAICIVFFLYPIDAILPWFSDIFPILKQRSIFSLFQEFDSIITAIIIGCGLIFLGVKAYEAF